MNTESHATQSTFAVASTQAAFDKALASFNPLSLFDALQVLAAATAYKTAITVFLHAAQRGDVSPSIWYCQSLAAEKLRAAAAIRQAKKTLN